jgi:hypothetical protein
MLFAARHRTSACARGGVIAWPAGVQGMKVEDWAARNPPKISDA